MINAWKVLWINSEGLKVFKKFEGDKPSEAVEFGKDLKRHGFLVDVVSMRKAFGPPRGSKTPQEHGILWCPYCIKYRRFDEFAVKMLGVVGSPKLRCPVCLISVRDAYVRKYNPDAVAKYDISIEMRELNKQRRKSGKR